MLALKNVKLTVPFQWNFYPLLDNRTEAFFKTVLEMTEIWAGYKHKREVDALFFSATQYYCSTIFLAEMGTESVGQGFVILQRSFAATEHL